MNEAKQLKLIAISHKEQWDGVDYQRAAIETAQEFDLDPIHDAETFELMERSPSENCPCATCRYLDATGMFVEIND